MIPRRFFWLFDFLMMGVAFLAAYAGAGPSLFAAVLGLAGVTYWFVPPRGSFAVWNVTAHVVASLAYLLVCALIIVVGEMSRRAKVKLNIAVEKLQRSDETLREAQEQLEERVQERTLNWHKRRRNSEDCWTPLQMPGWSKSKRQNHFGEYTGGEAVWLSAGRVVGPAN